jgi:Ca2+-binding EF-hand superfamily protein
MMKKLALIMFLLPSSLALAASNAGEIFDTLDQNGDGYLSKSEAASEGPLSASFDKYDKDGDGQISESEFEAYLNQ